MYIIHNAPRRLRISVSAAATATTTTQMDSLLLAPRTEV